MKRENDTKILYKEVLRPPFWLLCFVFFLLGSIAFAIWAAFDNLAGQISLALSIFALVAIATKVAMTIEVSESELRIGAAHIDRMYLGEVKELSIDEMRLTRGRDADPAAFLAIRFWQPHGIKIELRDPRDPTPYWLISSKHPGALAKALQNKKES
ncbi:MAG: DUF3093 domain-containing protein [Actinobacteria bacterium]|nr:DUF3093 domain-containing protein [Actinomycetota bacterium]